ncbi:carboxymuconolactone decarboxylase [Photobacterium damselae subsp. damselae]|uniref:carboxymuconolactone decarboxylase family protein n=1 Tax=Photobacterium damselae TaxID=38293 RepID=UPI000D04AC0F|nr:carboxymuconolactone decarboxylase family protein [Photobacterium damselae]PSB79691.1 carboxymuconolactone decarboxylase [Photobacterium damselae subsp. damselae]UKA04302.1 carboxymuconolactone decarboxylase family protein [Photobacterium damselae subsp. damselae]UKA30741.1 carboxymuconolactone decarboxylase family protein [Photobacterium damselae subsp. damselae]
METFTLHNLETAPEKSRPILDKTYKNLGRIPGLFSVMAEAPELLKAYTELHQHFLNTSFNDEELTVVWQTINVEHDCHYCVPAHTAIAYSMGIDRSIIDALRLSRPLENPKLQALKDFTLKIVRKRGVVSDEDLQTFYLAGYTPQQVLEIILGLSQKVISNYTNHVAKTPIDGAVKKFI